MIFDSRKENAFNVRLDDGKIIKFACDDKGMYVFLPEGTVNEVVKKENH